jgi:dissimilatory sulfite reductase (desulfoviridin) alpha/beta subunit
VEKNCPMKAVSLENGKAVINRELCNNCGRCVSKCPFKAVRADKEGYGIYVGGKWGKKAARGIALDPVFDSAQAVLETVEKCILFFRDKGEAGERFGDTIARVGFDTAQKLILSDELLERKNGIIGK